MKHAPIVALALAGALVAGCGGGSSITQDELDTVKEQLEAAEKAKKAADEAKKAAEDAKKKAEADAADAAAREKVEKERADAAAKRADELEKEAGHTANQLVQANARRVLAGLDTFLSGTYIGKPTSTVRSDAPMVTPRYRASALVDTAPSESSNPDVTFSSVTTGTSGNWFRTSFSHRGSPISTTDRLDVYTDAEAPTSAPFTSMYSTTAGETIVGRYLRTDDDTATTGINEGNPGTVINDNTVVGSVQISTSSVASEDRPDAASSSFPKSGDPRKDFDQIDPGGVHPSPASEPRVRRITRHLPSRGLPTPGLPKRSISRPPVLPSENRRPFLITPASSVTRLVTPCVTPRK